MNTEIFVQLPSELRNYAITQSGRIKNLITSEEVIPTRGNNTQYIGVTIIPIGSNRSVTMHLHRLLAIAFVPNNTGIDIDLLHVNHISGNKLDNSLNNLEWVTRSGNCTHAYKSGLRQDNILVELANAKNGEHMIHHSQAEAARFLGLNPSSLHEHMNTERRLAYPIRGFYASYCDHRNLGETNDSGMIDENEL